jgi:hypothetical protein
MMMMMSHDRDVLLGRAGLQVRRAHQPPPKTAANRSGEGGEGHRNARLGWLGDRVMIPVVCVKLASPLVATAGGVDDDETSA